MADQLSSVSLGSGRGLRMLATGSTRLNGALDCIRVRGVVATPRERGLVGLDRHAVELDCALEHVRGDRDSPGLICRTQRQEVCVNVVAE